MNLQAEIETKFSGKAFQRPLFYAYPQGLRFELSEGGSAIEQFLCAMRKAIEICSDIFELNGTLVACIRFWSKSSLFAHRPLFLELHSAGIEFPQKRCVWSEPVEDESIADAISPARWVNIAFEVPTTWLQNLLWCALATDFGNIRPRPECLVYLIDLKKEILVFPYDDRGMDVIGPNKTLLSTLYAKHTHYLLDADSFQELVEKAERLETMEVFQEGRASAQRNEPNPLGPILHQMPEVTLHEEDWDLFYEVLVHPPEPTEAFKTAWKEFKEQQG